MRPTILLLATSLLVSSMSLSRLYQRHCDISSEEELGYLFPSDFIVFGWLGVRSIQITYPFGHSAHYGILWVLSPIVGLSAFVCQLQLMFLVMAAWISIACNAAALAAMLLIFTTCVVCCCSAAALVAMILVGPIRVERFICSPFSKTLGRILDALPAKFLEQKNQ